jgi:hypothetical protein
MGEGSETVKPTRCSLSSRSHASAALALGLCLLAVLLFSCSRRAEKAEVEKAVIEYNNALVQAYRDAEITYMDPLATPEQVHRLVDVIVDLKQEKKRMRIRQESFAVEYVNVEEATAELVTRETWTYWIENTDTQERLEEEKTESYRIVYGLVKQHDKWLVDSLTST